MLRRFAILFCCSALFAASAEAQHVVSASLFGAGWNSVSPTGPQPNPWCPLDSASAIASLTSFRVWDDGMKWDQVETASNTFTWTKLDYLMGTLVTNVSCPMTVIYTVGGTPQWATACNGQADPGPCLPGPVGSGFGGGTQCANPDDWSCLPPSDIASDGTGTDAQFQTFLGTLLLRYPNQFSAIEGGNEWDSPNFWCSTSAVAACGSSAASLARAVRMAWDAENLMNCYSPSTKLASPSFHVGTAGTWFDNWLTTSINAPAGNITISGHTCTWSARTVTGKTILNGAILGSGIVNMHMRGTTGTNSDPTSVIAAYNAIASEMTSQGITGLPVWNDEWGPNSGQCPNLGTGAAYMAVELSLMASFSNPSISQENFYFWDNNDCVPSQTIVGLAHDVVAGWLTGATVNNYSVVGSNYTIAGTKAGSSFKILFDSSKTCSGATISTCSTTNQAETGFTTYVDIGGSSHAISGGVVPVGLAPIELTGSTSTGSPPPAMIARN
jgi:hypothetical protein